jgi:hypothetical protein
MSDFEIIYLILLIIGMIITVWLHFDNDRKKR